MKVFYERKNRILNINEITFSQKLYNKTEINSILVGILFLANLISNTISLIIEIPNIFAIVVVLTGIISIIKTGIKLNPDYS